MDLFVPEGSTITVAVGQRVKGGSQILALLPEGGR
jgi:hypothetical protein